MTLHQNLAAYYEELERGFHLYWMEILKDYGPETVHGLRVNLKRQNAFFHMLEALDERFSAGVALDTFDAIYDRSGNVRNKQVERGLIEKHERRLHLAHQLSTWLEEKESRRAKLLREYESGHSLAPIRELALQVYAVIRHLPSEGMEQRLQYYFFKLIHGIIDFIRQGEIPGDDLHYLRKFIKELFYNLDFLNRHAGQGAIQCGALVRLDELQHLLGKWHDYDFTLIHLSRKRSKHNPDFIAHLKNEKDELEVRLRELFGGLEEASRELEAKIAALWR